MYKCKYPSVPLSVSILYPLLFEFFHPSLFPPLPLVHSLPTPLPSIPLYHHFLSLTHHLTFPSTPFSLSHLLISPPSDHLGIITSSPSIMQPHYRLGEPSSCNKRLITPSPCNLSPSSPPWHHPE